MRVFENVSKLRKPSLLFKEIWADLRQTLSLAKVLAVREIKAKYRQTVFGLAWAFLPPAATTLAFVILQKQNVITSGVDGVPYPVFVMVGVVFWQLFAESVIAPLQVVQSSKSLLSKILFPREALLLAAIYQVVFNFSIKLVLLFVVMSCFGVTPKYTVFFVPIASIGLIMLGMCIGMILVPIGLLYQDVVFSLGTVLMLVMFITPIGFVQPDTGLLSTICEWNPVIPLLNCARDWTLGDQPESVLGLVYVMIGIGLLNFFGIVLYRLSLPFAVERLGS